MKLEELLGKYMRLRAEFSRAYAAGVWNADRLNRLGDDIALTNKRCFGAAS